MNLGARIENYIKTRVMTMATNLDRCDFQRLFDLSSTRPAGQRRTRVPRKNDIYCIETHDGHIQQESTHVYSPVDVGAAKTNKLQIRY